jgi:hypothetical protein
MNDMIDKLLGIDQRNEIFNLWYEVTFLRLILDHLVQNNSNLRSNCTPQLIDTAKEEAQKIVQKRFPMIEIKFNVKKQETTD